MSVDDFSDTALLGEVEKIESNLLKESSASTSSPSCTNPLSPVPPRQKDLRTVKSPQKTRPHLLTAKDTLAPSRQRSAKPSKPTKNVVVVETSEISVSSGLSLSSPSVSLSVLPPSVSPSVLPPSVSPSVLPPSVSLSILPPSVLPPSVSPLLETPSMSPPPVTPSELLPSVSPSVLPPSVSPSVLPPSLSPSVSPPPVSPSVSPPPVRPSVSPPTPTQSVTLLPSATTVTLPPTATSTRLPPASSATSSVTATPQTQTLNLQPVRHEYPIIESWKSCLPPEDIPWISKALFSFNAKGKPELDDRKIDRMWYDPPPGPAHSKPEA
nr:proline-rich extensin-like protein EPR1 [Crassostrea gigas]